MTEKSLVKQAQGPVSQMIYEHIIEILRKFFFL